MQKYLRNLPSLTLALASLAVLGALVTLGPQLLALLGGVK